MGNNGKKAGPMYDNIVGSGVERFSEDELRAAEKQFKSGWTWPQAVIQLACRVNRLEKEVAQLKEGRQE